MVGVIVLAVVLAAATVAGLARQRRGGRFRAAADRSRRQPRLTEADLGRPLGARATLLQFSSSFCAPCRAARLLMTDVAAREEGVAHVEIDVANRIDLVKLLDVRRTPTVFVLGPRGEITRRASGVPKRAELAVALAHASGRPGAPGNAETRQNLSN